MNSTEKKWLVFYTKSRHEKRVKAYLEKNGTEVFLPMHKTMRQWSDRKKKVEVPLFNSYIFVYETEQRIGNVLEIPGIAWNIRYDGKPALLSENDMNVIKRFLETGLFIEAFTAQELNKGDRVEILDGPLKGIIGELIQTDDGDKFRVALDLIGQVIQVKIHKWMLKRHY